jgi:hypothetical protein
MGNRLIFLYLVLLRRGDGEGYVSRATVVPV